MKKTREREIIEAFVNNEFNDLASQSDVFLKLSRFMTLDEMAEYSGFEQQDILDIVERSVL